MALADVYLRSPNPARYLEVPKQDLYLRQSTVVVTVSAGGTGPSLSSILSAWSGSAYLTGVWTPNVLDSPVARDQTNYSVNTLTGGVVSIQSCSFVLPTGSLEILTLSGDYRTGGTYQLLIRSNTVRDASTGAGVSDITASFKLTGSIFTGSVILAEPISATALNVTYVKPVTQVSPAGAFDSLNPANYSLLLSGTLSSLAVLTSTGLANDKVQLSLGANMNPVPYILTVTNVQDLLGNGI